MYKLSIVLLTTAWLALLTAACGKKTASDQTLVTDVQAKLYADALTKPANVSVTAKDGVISLSGDVPSSDVELEAMKIANATPGVSRVNDQMKVNPSLAANQPAPAANQPTEPNPVAPAGPAGPPPPQQAPATSAAPSPPPQPAIVTIRAGEHVSVRMIDSINSAHDTSGQVFRASLYDTSSRMDG